MLTAKDTNDHRQREMHYWWWQHEIVLSLNGHFSRSRWLESIYVQSVLSSADVAPLPPCSRKFLDEIDGHVGGGAYGEQNTTSLCTLPPWRTTMNLQQGRRIFPKTESRHFTESSLFGQKVRPEVVSWREETIREETAPTSRSEMWHRNLQRRAKHLTRWHQSSHRVTEKEGTPWASAQCIIGQKQQPHPWSAILAKSISTRLEAKIQTSSRKSNAHTGFHTLCTKRLFFTLTVMTIVGLHDFVKVFISASF